MSLDSIARPVSTDLADLTDLAGSAGGHVHSRSCFWDVFECRWSGPAHPRHAVRRELGVPPPRRVSE